MTPTQRRLVRIERIAHLLKNGDVPSIREIVRVPYVVAFECAGMVRSPIIDQTKIDEFARNTAEALVRIEQEIIENPNSVDKYFAD